MGSTVQDFPVLSLISTLPQSTVGSATGLSFDGATHNVVVATSAYRTNSGEIREIGDVVFAVALSSIQSELLL